MGTPWPAMDRDQFCREEGAVRGSLSAGFGCLLVTGEAGDEPRASPRSLRSSLSLSLNTSHSSSTWSSSHSSTALRFCPCSIENMKASSALRASSARRTLRDSPDSWSSSLMYRRSMLAPSAPLVTLGHCSSTTNSRTRRRDDPWMAAIRAQPLDTASSAFRVVLKGCLKWSCTCFWIIGTRIEPPTISTECKDSRDTPCEAAADVTSSRMRLIVGNTIGAQAASNASRSIVPPRSSPSRRQSMP
mmetsp:Transcript_14604/g.32202  ORF Transcript_14604/g.32202 Transcript_14604/m.32202 type:complete len:245 (-) Transcript_14604:924-1658(-)